MRIRLAIFTGLVACALAGAAALGGEPVGQSTGQAVGQLTGSTASLVRDGAGPGHRTGGDPRTLHPRHTSGGEAGAIAAPLPAARRAPSVTDRTTWQVSPGVTFTRWSQTDARGPIRAHLLTIDPSTPGLKIDYASMGPVRRVGPVAAILARDHAVAGVNGDFYDIGHTGAPLGLGLDRQRGLLHARQDGWNNAFYVNRKGRADIGDLPMTAEIRHHPRLHVTNLNSPFVAPGGIGVYTPRWGRTAGYGVTQGQKKRVRAVTVIKGRIATNRAKLSTDKAIKGLLIVGRGKSADLLSKLHKGIRIKVDWSLQGNPQMAISGNRFLVHDGIIRAVDDRLLHPRTAVGVDADTGEVLMLVIDGRSSRSRGYTMVELANLMIDLGADEAVNLDGGGSTTMVAKRPGAAPRVVNRPSDGFQRWVANAIEVTYRKPGS